MIKLLSVAFLFLFLSVNPELKKMRAFYVLMNQEESAAKALKLQAKSSTKVSANITAAYLAAAEMALAKYMYNPLAKLSAFNVGKKGLEAALSMDSSSIEVRYIRLTIQDNVPSILGYSGNIKSDRRFLIQHLKEVKTSDAELYSSVQQYLLKRGKLSEQEKRELTSSTTK